MFPGNSNKREEFLDKAKSAREERAQDRQRTIASIKIQAQIRGFLARRNIYNVARNELLEIITTSNEKTKFVPALIVFKAIEKYFKFCDPAKDGVVFENIVRYIIACMNTDETRLWYVSVALSNAFTVKWIQQIKHILWQCCLLLKQLKPETQTDNKQMTLYITMLVTFTDSSSWKLVHMKGGGENLKATLDQLCANIMGYLNTRGLYPVLKVILINGLARFKVCFKRPTLTALLTLALRPLIASYMSHNMLSLFLVNILSVPGLVLHTNTLARDCIDMFITHNILSQCIDVLTIEQCMKIVFNSLEGNYSLCLLANIINLAYLDKQGLTVSVIGFIDMATLLLVKCQQYVVQKKSHLTHWHPVLGWFSQNTDQKLHEAMPHVQRQLQLLWKPDIVKLMFDIILKHMTYSQTSQQQQQQQQQRQKQNVFKKAFNMKLSSTSSRHSLIKATQSTEVRTMSSVCVLYQTALSTLTQMKLEILTGLSYHDVLLSQLWMFICSLGPNGGLRMFAELLSSKERMRESMFSMLTLFCDCASHLLTILDDIELYEQQRPFCLEDLVEMSMFLNSLVYCLIWDNHDIFNTHAVLFNSTHNLLMLLYDRDCRRSYTPVNHWLIRDLKASSFMCDYERGCKRVLLVLQWIPHVIPHKERVMLFRRLVGKEKQALGLVEMSCTSPHTTLVTVHRSRLIEDGFQQLSNISTNALKGIIRVKFINEQGLDEAGIDQDGVFKEFLEETIKTVFDPGLNLFKTTSNEHHLYPSPTSHIQENHLSLIEFIGKIIGKAVYEGIVVEVPFALFFLTQVLRRHGAFYSFFDELPSLDPDLYKSLTFIKHYDGDVGDLELSFTCDEDFMGRVVTHELIPGGRVVPVSHENKISYMHLMAQFRMHTQIKDQTCAFIRGFKSIINPDWIMMFSAPELRRLISGDTTDLDIEDLKRHTQYFGGFHGAHRVIQWLWGVLTSDFNRNERQLFLKFVTSCSKPPLLGFAHLEPPFSIRCVEVCDDQDQGDTVGSVLRGFFTIRKKEHTTRLPTSSTCFNLLKLPNYSRKQTLRDKLRYAVNSNTGFELS